MKKIIIIALMLASFTSFAQSEIKTDTLRAVITLGNGKEIKQVYGYVVLETHNTLENMRNKVSRLDQLMYGRDYSVLTRVFFDDPISDEFKYIAYQEVKQ